MASGPVGPVTESEAQNRKRDRRDTLSHDIDDAIDDFVSRLNDIAKKHAQ
jgi:hypothetical protein